MSVMWEAGGPEVHPMNVVNVGDPDAQTAHSRSTVGMGIIHLSVPKIDTGGERRLIFPTGL